MARMPFDLSLYLVTDPALCGEIGVEETVRLSITHGATMVQLRDPDGNDDDIVRLGRALLPHTRAAGIPLIINDRVHLVKAIDAQGAHIGQGDMSVREARTLMGSDALLGLSVQTLDHVRSARELDLDAIDYLGVGPVWAQSTKPDAATPGGVDILAEIVNISPWPCVAIGGIDLARIPDVRQSGAQGAAVVSAICGQPDVAAATRALAESWRKNE
jgi:thiamine-phosphate pyrophosphorylase